MYFFVHMSESSREKNLSNCNCLKLSKIDILKISGIIGEINSQISPKRKKSPIKRDGPFEGGG